MVDAITNLASFFGFWLLMLIPFIIARRIKKRLPVIRWPLRLILVLLIASILPSFIVAAVLIAPDGDTYGMVSAGAAVVMLFVLGLIASSVAFAISETK
jgi:hypothetical protein